MKRLPFTVVLIMILLVIPVLTGGSECNPEAAIPSSLAVTIVQQPVGGTNVNSVTCQYKVAYFYDGSQVDGKWQDDRGEPAAAPRSITLVAVFVNDKGGEYSKQETKFGLGSGQSTSGTYTITKSAGQGMVLDKTFWVKFSWSETDGNKKISSAEAVCKV